MKIQVRGGSCLNYRGDALLLFHHSDVKPLTGNLASLDWRCNAAVSILWKRKGNLLKFGQLTIIATQGKVRVDTVILTGLGPGDQFDGDLRREALHLALGAALKIGARVIAVDGSSLGGDGGEGIVEDLRSVLGDMKKRGKFNITLFSTEEGRQSSRTKAAGTAGGAV